MKRGTPRHPKLTALATALGVPRWGAVGLLELLWHFAAEYAHAGDVGRFDDASIALALCWDGDSSQLISVLVRSGWLDRCKCHRLRVHDWPAHADQTVQRVLAKRNQSFAACYDDPSSVLARDEDETSQPLPLPLPLPLPSPTPSPEPLPSAFPSERALTLLPLTPKTKTRKPSHLDAYGVAWRERWGEASEPPWGEMATHLTPAIKKHGDVVLAPAWGRFLASSETSRWARPARFVQGLGEFLREGGPRSSNAAVIAGYRTLAEEQEGGV